MNQVDFWCSSLPHRQLRNGEPIYPLMRFSRLQDKGVVLYFVVPQHSQTNLLNKEIYEETVFCVIASTFLY